jgi:hypothetical protein
MRCRKRQLLIAEGSDPCPTDRFVPCTKMPGGGACARCKAMKEKCEE